MSTCDKKRREAENIHNQEREDAVQRVNHRHKMFISHL